MSWSMSWAVKNFKIYIADLYVISIIQPTSWLKSFSMTKSKSHGLFRQLINPKSLLNLRALNGDMQLLRKLLGGSTMI